MSGVTIPAEYPDLGRTRVYKAHLHASADIECDWYQRWSLHPQTPIFEIGRYSFPSRWQNMEPSVDHTVSCCGSQRPPSCDYPAYMGRIG
jgi:hypothetical protein